MTPFPTSLKTEAIRISTNVITTCGCHTFWLLSHPSSFPKPVVHLSSTPHLLSPSQRFCSSRSPLSLLYWCSLPAGAFRSAYRHGVNSSHFKNITSLAKYVCSIFQEKKKIVGTPSLQDLPFNFPLRPLQPDFRPGPPWHPSPTFSVPVSMPTWRTALSSWEPFLHLQDTGCGVSSVSLSSLIPWGLWSWARSPFYYTHSRFVALNAIYTPMSPQYFIFSSDLPLELLF